ncbi:type II toxin-antitoxin system Phd/YefM family antitoxin [Macrococcoides goetzii]|nr:type II toxin-antitoxin system Phd/YefM family antitoxin [Macrococcus goetzii]TDM39282.1 type II toxin-antitoxin system Phd/YefM family antitoxin [Macrococcus goetzii]TDM44149.1 type II toxin-antitoxin system Phd/YefM family antitoxin [Macrococcus goetzii]TDM47341.1 type II toxin-antitoxin system Phd/YefM family antitoxin [Macrococcus goetzii]
MKIRPVSDLRNKFAEIEKDVIKEDAPVFLTKNGYGTMVLMSIDKYSKLAESHEAYLLESEVIARTTKERMTHEEVFGNLKEKLNGKREI